MLEFDLSLGFGIKYILAELQVTKDKLMSEMLLTIVEITQCTLNDLNSTAWSSFLVGSLQGSEGFLSALKQSPTRYPFMAVYTD